MLILNCYLFSIFILFDLFVTYVSECQVMSLKLSRDTNWCANGLICKIRTANGRYQNEAS
jgi:hypothetical protein